MRSNMKKDYSILVVDDEKSIRFTTKAMLSKEGYKVSTAACFSEALDLMTEEDFDLVFTDVMLGGKSGFDLLQVVKEQNPDCHVVLFTGYPNTVFKTAALRLGAKDYMSKPLVKSKLLHAAKTILNS